MLNSNINLDIDSKTRNAHNKGNQSTKVLCVDQNIQSHSWFSALGSLFTFFYFLTKSHNQIS